MSITAHQTYQLVLDGIDAALKSGDFDAYAKHFALPHKVETFDLSTNFDTAQDLRRLFVATRECMALRNVAEMVRTCTRANFVDDETISGFHETRLLSDKFRIMESYVGLMVVTHHNGEWLAAESQFSSSASTLPGEAVTKSMLNRNAAQ